MYVTKQIQNKLQKKKINAHQRSILREMMSTCDKLGNSFLTKQESKHFQQKQKLQKQLTRKSGIIQKQNSLERFSHDPFRCTKDNIMEDFIYVKESKQIKQIKDLKQKMLPKVNKTNIEKKLKELTYIRNMGFKSKNTKLESFKSLTRYQDQQNILNKSWQGFYQDKFYTSPIQTPQTQEYILRSNQRNNTKKCTYLVQKQKTIQLLNSNNTSFSNSETFEFSSSSPSFFKQQSQKHGQTLQINFSRTQSYSKNQEFNQNCKSLNQRQMRISSRNKTLFKEVLKNVSKKKKSQQKHPHTTPYALSSDRKKQITQKIGLNKQKLQKQNAFKLYSLIKGGYDLDRHEVEGQHISLKRFKEAKQNFKMLKSCFNKVKQNRYIIQSPEKKFNNCSFKSLVYLSEIQNKISPSLFRKMQQSNNIVD